MLYTKNSTVIFSLTAKIAQIVGIKVKKQNFFVIILHNVNFFSNFAKIAQKFYLLSSQYSTPPRGKNAVILIFLMTFLQKTSTNIW